MNQVIFLFDELDKNVQKQINEDEKFFMNIIEIKVDDSLYKNNNIIQIMLKRLLVIKSILILFIIVIKRVIIIVL